MNFSNSDDRLTELLIDRATSGLLEEEKQELQHLLDEKGIDDDFSFDAVVASLYEAFDESAVTINEESNESLKMVSLPKRVRTQILENAVDVLATTESAGTHSLTEAKTSGILQPEKEQVRRSRRREIVAWTLATAAAITAILGWFGRPTSNQTSTELIYLSGQKQLSEFINSSDENNLFEVKLEPGNDKNGENATGTVYWNRTKKRGFLKINSLQQNSPNQEQYQLWVIDRQRGIEDRPNAGVFNISEQGDAIYEFRSDLEVFDAQGFAVTVEKPGGVNKSDLSRIALLNLGTN